MNTMREFSRRLSHFKRLASAGKRIHLVDRQGKRFVFAAEKPSRAFGAGRHLATRVPLSPQRTPSEEWRGAE
jgi:hypothetical protein